MRTLASVKSDIIQALLQIHQISHSMTGYNFFTCEYRSSSAATNVFVNKSVKFTVDMSLGDKSNDTAVSGDVYVKFKMISGNANRFRKIVQVLYAHMCDKAEKYNIMQRPSRPRNNQNERDFKKIENFLVK